MKKWIAFLMILALVLGVVPAPAESADVQAVKYTSLTVGTTTAFTGNFYSPVWGNNVSDMDVRNLTQGYSPVKWDGDNGAFVFNDFVVTGTLVTDDKAGNRTYTIGIADDLYYSDGSRITAADYAFALLLEIAKETEKIGGGRLDGSRILGYDEYESGASDALLGFRILGEDRFSLTIAADYRPFFYELGLLDIVPLPIEVIAPECHVVDNGQGIKIVGEFTEELLRKTMLDPENGFMSHPSVFSGSYMLTAYDGKQAEFVANPYYKGNEHGLKPDIKTIVYRVVDNDEAIELLENGEIGLLTRCVRSDVIQSGLAGIASGELGMSTYARNGFSFVSFCCEQETVAETEVRQAIAMCMDREALTEAYTGGFGLMSNGYYGIGQWMYQMTIEGGKEDTENAISLEDLTVYEFDPEQAARKLDESGWKLNGSVRSKEIGGKTVSLNLKLIYPEGNLVADQLVLFAENLAGIGVRLMIEPVPMEKLLRLYYRQDQRDCDMIYLATNFYRIFDPSDTFDPADVNGLDNMTGIKDETLYQLAVDMRKTEPDDVGGYMRKWVEFQKCWTEVLPAIPVYSNAYFDLYTSILQNYTVSASTDWTQAIVGSYLSDVMREPEPEEETEDDLFIFE